jgi:hypothetical protein
MMKRFYFFANQTNTTGAESLIERYVEEKSAELTMLLTLQVLSSSWKRGGLVILS